MEKQCEECGRSFTVDVTKRNWQRVKFCSLPCQKKKSNRDRAAKYVPQVWPQNKSCMRCGTEFMVYKPGGKQEYCSKECWKDKREENRRLELESQKQPHICIGCGSSFLPTKYNPRKQVYCSKSCYFKATRMDDVSAVNRYANITELAKAKRVVKKRDGKTCLFCGKEGKTQIHHLDFSGGNEKGNNHPDNLITLCVPCHKAIHHVALVQHEGRWVVRGKIFSILGLTGSIEIT